MLVIDAHVPGCRTMAYSTWSRRTKVTQMKKRVKNKPNGQAGVLEVYKVGKGGENVGRRKHIKSTTNNAKLGKSCIGNGRKRKAVRQTYLKTTKLHETASPWFITAFAYLIHTNIKIHLDAPGNVSRGQEFPTCVPMMILMLMTML